MTVPGQTLLTMILIWDLITTVSIELNKRLLNITGAHQWCVIFMDHGRYITGVPWCDHLGLTIIIDPTVYMSIDQRHGNPRPAADHVWNESTWWWTTKNESLRGGLVHIGYLNGIEKWGQVVHLKLGWTNPPKRFVGWTTKYVPYDVINYQLHFPWR